MFDKHTLDDTVSAWFSVALLHIKMNTYKCRLVYFLSNRLEFFNIFNKYLTGHIVATTNKGRLLVSPQKTAAVWIFTHKNIWLFTHKMRFQIKNTLAPYNKIGTNNESISLNFIFRFKQWYTMMMCFFFCYWYPVNPLPRTSFLIYLSPLFNSSNPNGLPEWCFLMLLLSVSIIKRLSWHVSDNCVW